MPRKRDITMLKSKQAKISYSDWQRGEDATRTIQKNQKLGIALYVKCVEGYI